MQKFRLINFISSNFWTNLNYRKNQQSIIIPLLYIFFPKEISSFSFREEWKSCNTFQYFLYMQEFRLINFISSNFWTNLNYRKNQQSIIIPLLYIFFPKEISSFSFREEWKSCNTFQYFLYMQEFRLINFISKFWTNLNYREESTINYYPSSLRFSLCATIRKKARYN